MNARVFQGFDLAGALASISTIALGYVGGFAVLWALGLVVRGWRGWLLVVAPLVLIAGARLWAWRRVCVELADGVLRYEGVSTREDFEVPLEQVQRLYFDRMLPGRPLVLVLASGAERSLPRVRPAAAQALRDALVAGGAVDIHAA